MPGGSGGWGGWKNGEVGLKKVKVGIKIFYVISLFSVNCNPQSGLKVLLRESKN